MKLKCVNKKHPDFIELSKQSTFHPELLAAKVSIWQDQNNTDEFPTVAQLAKPVNDNKIRHVFKTTTAIINKLDKVNQWYKTLGNTDKFWNKVQQDLQIPKEQIVLLKESEGNTIEEKLLDFATKSIIQDTAKQTITEVQESDVEAKVRELEREGLLEIDCKGKLKAEKGLATSFVKGGKWKVIKDLKGYPTHKEGGVDLTIGKNGVTIKNGNTQFTAKYGLVIPKN